MASSDLELLAALFETPFASYADLGRRVGMTGQGARKRLLRLEEEEVYNGVVATPVPDVFDRQGTFLAIEREDPPVQDALALEDVVLAGATLDGLFSLAGFVEPGTRKARRSGWLEALGGGPIVYEGTYRDDVSVPPLGPLDWRVLAALLEAPRAPLTQLAEATGLTRRTVGQRRQHLVASGALEVTPLLGASRAGRIFFHLAVIGYAGPVEQLPNELPGTVLAEHVGPMTDAATGAVLFCEAASLGDQHDLVDRAGNLPGVQEARAYLLEAYHVNTPRLAGWIDEALDRWEATRRSREDA